MVQLVVLRLWQKSGIHVTFFPAYNSPLNQKAVSLPLSKKTPQRKRMMILPFIKANTDWQEEEPFQKRTAQITWRQVISHSRTVFAFLHVLALKADLLTNKSSGQVRGEVRVPCMRLWTSGRVCVITPERESSGVLLVFIECQTNLTETLHHDHNRVAAFWRFHFHFAERKSHTV